MVAVQQGAGKRSAEEVDGYQLGIPAGGKMLKKAQKKPPFLCANYRRDVASFLPRAQIQQWRQTSKFSNAVLSRYPHRLPRVKFHAGLTMNFASGNACRVQKKGFLEINKYSHTLLHTQMDGKEFRSIHKYRFCCRDVRDRASELLVGQRLFPGKPDNEGLAFKLHVNGMCRRRGEKTLVCRVANRLTKSTAPTMLHFLHHLSRACFEHVWLIPHETESVAECALNPLVLSVLPEFQLRGVKFGKFDFWYLRHELSARLVRMATAMRISFDVLYMKMDQDEDYEDEFESLLNLIATGRPMNKRLVIRGMLHEFNIDDLIKHFEGEVRSLEEAIRDVGYDGIVDPDYHYNYPLYYDWSRETRFEREAATQAIERADGSTDYRFDYVNAHSGEPFSLLLGTRPHEEESEIFKFHLTFGTT